MIEHLEPNEIFVFGSNTAGIHGAGAALQAHRQFGAKLGCGVGLTGDCYAFPTLNERFERLPLSRLESERDELYRTCGQNPGWLFLLTKVGCGLAGFPEATMRGLFINPPINLILPEDWRSANGR
jgi:hypothetical protein